MLSWYDWIYGIVQLSAGFLAVIAGAVALVMFGRSWRHRMMRAWWLLLVAAVFFAIEEVLGALDAFGVYSTPNLTHVVPGIILGFVIAALIKQIYLSRGCV